MVVSESQDVSASYGRKSHLKVCKNGIRDMSNVKVCKNEMRDMSNVKANNKESTEHRLRSTNETM